MKWVLIKPILSDSLTVCSVALIYTAHIKGILKKVRLDGGETAWGKDFTPVHDGMGGGGVYSHIHSCIWSWSLVWGNCRLFQKLLQIKKSVKLQIPLGDILLCCNLANFLMFSFTCNLRYGVWTLSIEIYGFRSFYCASLMGAGAI